MNTDSWRAATLLACTLLGGCASAPPQRARDAVAADVEQRTGARPALADEVGDALDADTARRLQEPLTPEAAVAVAFARNPRLQARLAELGVARAEILEAGRLSNPTFAYARLRERGGGGIAIDASLTQSFADLLLLGPRRRLAEADLVRVQRDVAAALVALAAEVEADWFEDVGARQVAAMRAAAHDAAQASAELAQRFFDAGNITRLQLSLEQAAQAQARLELLRARAASTRARAKLAAAMGLDGAQAWDAGDRLPAPVAAEDELDALLRAANERRLDLAAARAEVESREAARRTTRRWRWLGRFELGVDREKEPGDAERRGASASIEVPVFNQQQGAVARADAKLLEARARLRELELAAGHEVRLGVARVAAAREIAEQYRVALVPLREAVVARTQERQSYMLAGVFELIQAKQQEYDAYQGYLEAVRDYWLARVDLERATGARLPSAALALAPTLGPDESLERKPEPHHHHGAQP